MDDIKKMLLELIDSETTNSHTYMEIERLIFIMMQDYLQKQNKKINRSEVLHNMNYDMLLPDGIDDISGKVAVEIKIFKNSYMRLSRIYDTIGRIAVNANDIDALILIIVNEVPQEFISKIEEKSKSLNFMLLIWDINKLVRIFETNTKLFDETYHNLSVKLLQDTINRGITRNKEEYKEIKEKYTEQLCKEYKNDKVVLFLGAGASKDANIATWDTLIWELLVALVDNNLKEKNIQMQDYDKETIIAAMLTQNEKSPLMQARFLRNGFKNSFEERVREILYKNAAETSNLLEEIGQLCIPNRGKFGIQAIVNYNFDDLVEKNLKRLRVSYHSVYGEGMIPETEELGIYHVHGFLPQDKDGYTDLAKSLLVFSEEGYHKLMLEPYNWANIVQLNFMTNYTCVFIGLSMTDPNMRRLLEIAAQKRAEENSICRHYAILKRVQMQSSEKNDVVKKLEGVNNLIHESVFQEIGVNVIWVDEYSEIPKILKRIKGKYE